MTEDWKPIPGFDGYEASSLGNIRSWRKNGYGKALREEPKTLSPAARNKRTGHLFVVLRKGTERHNTFVHTAVLLAFVGPRPDGMECCHNDGNPLNNTVENLRWDTRIANFADRDKHGTTAVGSRHGRHTMPEKTARGDRHGMWGKRNGEVSV